MKENEYNITATEETPAVIAKNVPNSKTDLSRTHESSVADDSTGVMPTLEKPIVRPFR